MNMGDYFAKIEHIADILVLTRKPVELNDFIMHVLTRFDSSKYESLVTVVLVRGEKITLDDLYSLLLSHEIKIEHEKGNIASDDMHNMTANIIQRVFYSGRNNGGPQKTYGGGNNYGNSAFGGFNPSVGQFNEGENSLDVIC